MSLIIVAIILGVYVAVAITLIIDVVLFLKEIITKLFR